MVMSEILLLAAEQLSVATRWLLVEALTAGFALGLLAGRYYRRSEHCKAVKELEDLVARLEEAEKLLDEAMG